MLSPPQSFPSPSPDQRYSVCCQHLVPLLPVLRCTYNFPSCFSRQSFLSHHTIDVRFRQPSGVIGDGDGIGSSNALVLGKHILDSIRIDIERNFNRGKPRGAWLEAFQQTLQTLNKNLCTFMTQMNSPNHIFALPHKIYT